MVGTQPFWKGGTRTTNVASLCQMLGGLRSRLCSMTNFALEGRADVAKRQERTRSEKNCVLSLSKEGVQGPINHRPDFVEANRE